MSWRPAASSPAGSPSNRATTGSSSSLIFSTDERFSDSTMISREKYSWRRLTSNTRRHSGPVASRALRIVCRETVLRWHNEPKHTAAAAAASAFISFVQAMKSHATCSWMR